MGRQALGAGTCLLCPWRVLQDGPSHPDLLTFLLLRLILESSHFTRSQLLSRQHVLGVGLCVQKAWAPRSSSTHQPRCAPAASLPGGPVRPLVATGGTARGSAGGLGAEPTGTTLQLRQPGKNPGRHQQMNG